MSLIVTDAIIKKARKGTASEEDFIGVMRQSLPLAFNRIHGLIHELDTAPHGIVAYEGGAEDADERSQLLRLFASTSMRRAMERFCGAHMNQQIRLGFLNCHNPIIYGEDKRPEEEQKTKPRPTFDDLTSFTAQLLHQAPQFQHC